MNAKIQLFKGKTHADGTHPIQLQYYVDGKTKRKTVARCRPEEWDERACRLKARARNATYINMRLTEAITEAERLVYAVMSGQETKAVIFNAPKSETLVTAIDNEIARYRNEINPRMVRRVNSYQKILSGYYPLSGIIFSQINERWVRGLIAHLTNKGNKPATIAKLLSFVKKLIEENYKVSEEIKAIRLPSAVRPVKQKLSIDELKAMAGLDLSGARDLDIARDIFVLQVYLRGIRIGDILQAKSEDFKQGRFHYTADKTGKKYSINVIPDAKKIVDKYLGKGEYLFPLFNWTYSTKISAFENEQRRLNCKSSCTTIVNKNLKVIAKKAGVKKPLSTHIARHTFARLAIDKVHNPMVTMELLGHSSLKVHQQYLKDIRQEDALDKAVNEIFSLT